MKIAEAIHAEVEFHFDDNSFHLVGQCPSNLDQSYENLKKIDLDWTSLYDWVHVEHFDGPFACEVALHFGKNVLGHAVLKWVPSSYLAILTMGNVVLDVDYLTNPTDLQVLQKMGQCWIGHDSGMVDLFLQSEADHDYENPSLAANPIDSF